MAGGVAVRIFHASVACVGVGRVAAIQRAMMSAGGNSMADPLRENSPGKSGEKVASSPGASFQCAASDSYKYDRV